MENIIIEESFFIVTADVGGTYFRLRLSKIIYEEE